MTDQLLILTIPPIPNTLNFYIHSEGDNHVSKTLLNEGIWEAFETKLFLACLVNGAKVLDVGANIGYYTVLASKSIGASGSVIAYEPSADNFELLRKNIKANQIDNSYYYPLALSNSDKKGFLYLSEDNYGDHQIYDNNEARQTQNIKLVNGDNHIGQHLDKVDLIKIDTQGAEWAVLQGLEKLIKNSLPKLNMILEFSPNSLRLAGSEPDELLKFIYNLNLPIAMIDHIDHQLIPASFIEMKQWSDATKPDINDMGFFNLFIGEPPKL